MSVRVNILFHYFESTTFKYFERDNEGDYLTLSKMKGRVAELLKRQLKSGQPSTPSTATPSTTLLQIFNRRKIEDYMYLKFWLTNKLESILLEDNHSMQRFLKAHENPDRTINCTIEVDDDKTYFATEFKEELLCSAKFCLEVYNVNENPKNGLRNTIEVDLMLGEKRYLPVVRSDSYLEDTEHMRFMISEGSYSEMIEDKQVSKKRLFVVVRGTVDLNNWMSNINVVSEAFHESAVGKVHQGFHDMVGKIRAAEILRRLKYEGNKNHDDQQFDQIVLCGHSLGGAIASLLCSHIYLLANKSLSNKQLLCVTFGAPPVGDSNFCNFISADHQYDITQSNFIHIVHEGDMVPRVMYVLEAMKRYTSEGSIFSTSEMYKLGDASEKLQEALVANGSRSSLEPAMNRYFGETPSQFRRILKLGYRSTKTKSLIQVLFNAVLHNSIAEYEAFGCVLLFPRGVESRPVVCIGDPRNELQKLEDLYNFDSCSVEWHKTNVYLSSTTKFVREFCNPPPPPPKDPIVIANGLEEMKTNDVREFCNPPPPPPKDPIVIANGQEETKTNDGPPNCTLPQTDDNLVDILLDILSLSWIPSRNTATEVELAIWKLRHYSVNAARGQKDSKTTSLSSFLLAEDFELENFTKQFEALFVVPKKVPRRSGGKALRRAWGFQLFRTLCALNSHQIFNTSEHFKTFVVSLFKDPKSDWGWLNAADIEVIRPFAIALEGMFDENSRTHFASLFSFFQTTEPIISPLLLTKPAVGSSRFQVFEIGTEVDVNYKDRGEWHRGKVIEVKTANKMCTYDVKFDGGLEEKSVEVKLMRIANFSGYVQIEEGTCWKGKVRHLIVLEQGVLTYGHENKKRQQPLYLKNCVVKRESQQIRASIYLPGWTGPTRLCSHRTDDVLIICEKKKAVEKLKFSASKQGEPSLEDWKKHIEAHILFVSGSSCTTSNNAREESSSSSTTMHPAQHPLGP